MFTSFHSVTWASTGFTSDSQSFFAGIFSITIRVCWGCILGQNPNTLLKLVRFVRLESFGVSGFRLARKLWGFGFIKLAAYRVWGSESSSFENWLGQCKNAKNSYNGSLGV